MICIEELETLKKGFFDADKINHRLTEDDLASLEEQLDSKGLVGFEQISKMLALIALPPGTLLNHNMSNGLYANKILHVRTEFCLQLTNFMQRMWDT